MGQAEESYREMIRQMRELPDWYPDIGGEGSILGVRSSQPWADPFVTETF
jgi:hypothetical protein